MKLDEIIRRDFNLPKDFLNPKRKYKIKKVVKSPSKESEVEWLDTPTCTPCSTSGT